MRFCDLVGGLSGDPRSITAITCDSRVAKEGTLFFCVRGFHFDGHSFAADAYRRGCRHFVAEQSLDLSADATVLTVENSKRAMAEIASRFWREPANDLTVIGVTGTKGKTSTAYMIKKMLDAVGIPTGYIGSLGIFYGEYCRKTENTTPGCIEVQEALSQMRDAGIETAVIEVSSQALADYRVWGIPFFAVIFTNLSRDHIGEGEHADMREYRDAKLSLFTDYGAPLAILNADDPFSVRIAASTSALKVLLYGRGEEADIRIGKCVALRNRGRLGMMAEIARYGKKYMAMLPFFGEHYADNFAAALACVSAVGNKTVEELLPLSSTLSVPGRCEVIPTPHSGTFVIDYAHNGASLAAALRGLRPYTAGRLYCLFGAVGERSKCRRRDMAYAASRYADFSVITEDNPGREAVTEIMTEIFQAFPRKENAICIPDRGEAIRYLYGLACIGDVVLLAGKGDEEYQLRAEGRSYFSERELLEVLAGEGTGRTHVFSDNSRAF